MQENLLSFSRQTERNEDVSAQKFTTAARRGTQMKTGTAEVNRRQRPNVRAASPSQAAAHRQSRCDGEGREAQRQPTWPPRLWTARVPRVCHKKSFSFPIIASLHSQTHTHTDSCVAVRFGLLWALSHCFSADVSNELSGSLCATRENLFLSLQISAGTLAPSAVALSASKLLLRGASCCFLSAACAT